MLGKKAFVSISTQTDQDLIFKVLRNLDQNDMTFSHDESNSEKTKIMKKKKTGRPKKFTSKSKNDDEEIDDYILDTIGESGIINDCNEANNIFIRKPEIDDLKLIGCKSENVALDSQSNYYEFSKNKFKKKILFEINFPSFISVIKDDRKFTRIFKHLVKSITSIESQNFYDELKYFKKSGKDMTKYSLTDKISIFLFWLSHYLNPECFGLFLDYAIILLDYQNEKIKNDLSLEDFFVYIFIANPNSQSKNKIESKLAEIYSKFCPEQYEYLLDTIKKLDMLHLLIDYLIGHDIISPNNIKQKVSKLELAFEAEAKNILT